MAQLAIKGHPTRGKEVIQLLETLGGINSNNLKAISKSYFYYIKDAIINIEIAFTEDFKIYTLEEFEEKFPYKVGDKVQYKGATSCGSVYVIEQMKWEDNQVKYVICDLYWKNCKCTVISKDLQPYKEETNMKTDCKKCGLHYGSARCFDMDYCPNHKPKSNAVGLKDGEVIECEVNMKDNKATGSRIDFSLTERIELELGDTHEVVVENGKTYVVKKKPTYSKDYDECCEVLGISDNRGFGFINLSECENTLMSHFIQLKRCRNAYWKIAGEQMGLDKPWEPDWNNGHVEKYYIYLKQNEINKSSCFFDCHFLAFPTKEMRDAFCENFKDLIEQCKELL